MQLETRALRRETKERPRRGGSVIKECVQGHAASRYDRCGESVESFGGRESREVVEILLSGYAAAYDDNDMSDAIEDVHVVQLVRPMLNGISGVFDRERTVMILRQGLKPQSLQDMREERKERGNLLEREDAAVIAILERSDAKAVHVTHPS
jgi:hypothetical protein